jgi:NAD(P)-dependent dehydrogenase (short-subunit alcohol dehydrogenase family)
MSRIFITGSTGGLGLMAAVLLLKDGHQVTLHARNALGHHNAVIHNAGVGYREPRRIQTADGLSHVFAINVLAPHLLTALITRPQRLAYLSSGMHTGGDAALDDPQWEERRWNGAQAYSDSKLDDAGPADVEAVIVGGDIVKRDGKLSGANVEKARELMHQTCGRLRSRMAT